MNTNPSELKRPMVLPAAGRIGSWVMSGIGPRIALAPEGVGGGAGDPPAGDPPTSTPPASTLPAETPPAGDPPKGAEGKSKLSDTEAGLLQDVMKQKNANKDLKATISDLETKLRAFDGINIDEVRQMLQDRADNERKDAEKRGEFDRVKEMMVSEHQAQLDAERAARVAAEEREAKLQTRINDLTVGSKFSVSPFISEKLVLTPTKARAVYGSHFEVEDGVVVAYDKPAGASNRTRLVDASGELLAFDAALARLVDADPERDALLKGRMAPGGGSSAPKDGAPPAKDAEVFGLSAIERSLALRKK